MVDLYMLNDTLQVPTVTKSLGRPPCLAVVLVGNRPDSLLYVTRKQEAALQVRLANRIQRSSFVKRSPEGLQFHMRTMFQSGYLLSKTVQVRHIRTEHS